MKKQAFHFDLPQELIAQYPLDKRSDSRLLIYHKATKTYKHSIFENISDFLNPGDLLVLNDTQVIPARLYGHKMSGGKVELLIEKRINPHEFLSHIKASKSPRAGTLIQLNNAWQIEVLAKQDDLYHCKIAAGRELDKLLEDEGHVPLPLYINREDEHLDLNRYQTIYARHKGSVAAPTAGLHFDETVLHTLQKRGIKISYVTLHVGAGTFRPVRCDNILDHKMHAEQCTVSQTLCALVDATKKAGNRVIAVGTTAMRSLESAAKEGRLKPFNEETSIFIYPGYQFKVCDGLITNFHLPESTLLMLVAAFIGHAEIMELYRIAIEAQYRFYSYGDTSLLL